MASHNSKDHIRREAYIRKQLQQTEAWQGSLVHQAINAFVFPTARTGRSISTEEVVRQALELAQRQLAFSAARRYRAPGMTKAAAGQDFCALYDHEQGRAISPERVQEAFQVIATSLQNLCRPGGFLDFVCQGYAHKTEVPLTFPLDGTTVSSYVDLLYHLAPERPVIVDWKVSRNGGADYEGQLLVYALAFLRSPGGRGIPPEALELYGVNLLLDRVVQHPATPEKLARTEDFILKSADTLQALTGGRSYRDLELGDFEYAGSEKSCQYCRFLELCRGL